MFYKQFSDTESSYQYLAAIKWEEGYICKKCNHITFVRQENLIRTAIHVVSRTKVQRRAQCLISVRSKQSQTKALSVELSHEFGLRQMTCWDFKLKVQQATRGSRRFSLNPCRRIFSW